MKHLFVGDVVGRPGRRVLQRLLPELVAQRDIDYVVVNIENAAGGTGVNARVLTELDSLPIDCYTSGNHIWDKREGLPFLDSGSPGSKIPLLRPANYPVGNPGTGLCVTESAGGIPVATINLEGRVYMKDLDSPFVVADRLLQEIGDRAKVIMVDFHAEATSEKQAMGVYLDGRVSAVFGTHTHVPTGDERVLAGGTAFITDVGMTGPYDSIIGFKPAKVLQRFALQRNISLEVAKQDPRMAAAIVDIDESTGKARQVERLLLPLPVGS